MIVMSWSEGFQACSKLVSVVARDASLSDSCTSDRCCFSRLDAGAEGSALHAATLVIGPQVSVQLFVQEPLAVTNQMHK